MRKISFLFYVCISLLSLTSCSGMLSDRKGNASLSMGEDLTIPPAFDLPAPIANQPEINMSTNSAPHTTKHVLLNDSDSEFLNKVGN